MALTHRTSLAPRRPPRERALTPPPEYPACAPAFQHKSAQRHARGRDALITDVHKECFSSRYTPKCSLQATHASKTSLFPPPPPSPRRKRGRGGMRPSIPRRKRRWADGARGDCWASTSPPVTPVAVASCLVGWVWGCLSPILLHPFGSPLAVGLKPG